MYWTPTSAASARRCRATWRSCAGRCRGAGPSRRSCSPTGSQVPAEVAEPRRRRTRRRSRTRGGRGRSGRRRRRSSVRRRARGRSAPGSRPCGSSRRAMEKRQVVRPEAQRHAAVEIRPAESDSASRAIPAYHVSASPRGRRRGSCTCQVRRRHHDGDPVLPEPPRPDDEWGVSHAAAGRLTRAKYIPTSTLHSDREPVPAGVRRSGDAGTPFICSFPGANSLGAGPEDLNRDPRGAVPDRQRRLLARPVAFAAERRFERACAAGLRRGCRGDGEGGGRTASASAKDARNTPGSSRSMTDRGSEAGHRSLGAD